MNEKADGQIHGQGIAALRTISFRLSSTPRTKLPVVIPFLTGLLESCQSVLSIPKDHQSGKGALSVIRHKYDTQLSALLNAKTDEEQWTAVILIKCTVEFSGVSNSLKIGAWIRGLVAILQKPINPPTTKRLCILTLTRIFILSHESSSLVREYTTPSLPHFVTACLNLIESSNAASGRLNIKTVSNLQEAVLQSFCHLLPRHTTIFRAYVPRLRQILLPLIAPTPSSTDADQYLRSVNGVSLLSVKSAQALSVLLNFCSPKPQVAQQWSDFFSGILNEIHNVAIEVFQAGGEKADLVPRFTQKDSLLPTQNVVGLDLPTWSGMHSGCERFIGLLQILEDCFNRSTSISTTIPIGKTFDLLHKTMSVVVPLSGNTVDSQHNTESQITVSREEREQFWSQLPRIHATVMQTLATMFQRLRGSCKALVLPTLHHLEWVFKHERYRICVRIAVYKLTRTLVSDSGPGFTKSTVRQLSHIMQSCCDDLEAANTSPWRHRDASDLFNRADDERKSALGNLMDEKGEYNAPSIIPADLANEAHKLLPVLLSQLRAEFIPQSIRLKIDQTAILAHHCNGIWASVLNPALDKRSEKTISSLLPWMARAYPMSQEIEAFLRPRMPLISIGGGSHYLTANIERSGEVMSNVRSVSPSSSDSADSLVKRLDASASPSLFISQERFQRERSTSTSGEPFEVSRNFETTENVANVSLKRAASLTTITETDSKRRQYSPGEKYPEIEKSAKGTISEDELQPSTTDQGARNEDQSRQQIEVNQSIESEDDDDFEIPPLTMEPDTEDEENA